jgi:hypothetical protein
LKVFAFDVDDTLSISNGPIPLEHLLELKAKGEAVGLCGNLHCFMERVPDWPRYISFTMNFDTLYTLGGLLPKEYWLRTFLVSCRNAEAYYFIGNELGITGASDDKGSCERAGPPWKFIREDEWMSGVREKS